MNSLIYGNLFSIGDNIDYYLGLLEEIFNSGKCDSEELEDAITDLKNAVEHIDNALKE